MIHGDLRVRAEETNLSALTKKQYWLMQHQITAFWHGFGISGSLAVPKEFVEVGRGGFRGYYHIKPEFMRAQLKEYIKWLATYKESWNLPDDEHEKEIYPAGWASFLEDEKSHESRADILEMIRLLQNLRGAGV